MPNPEEVIKEGAEIHPWNEGEVVEDIYEVIRPENWPEDRKEYYGEGGMGRVYFVKHKRWGITLAVKSPLPKILEDKKKTEDFIDELNRWVELGRHPNITSCFYVRSIDGVLRAFIEYVGGGSLEEWICNGKIDTLEKALDIAIQICEGMDYAYKNNGIVHRDLKPANVLMSSEASRNAMITDFGLAGSKEGGTPPYMAPELWEEGVEATVESDVYAFGVMLFELVCLGIPFELTEEECELDDDEYCEAWRKKHKEEKPKEPWIYCGYCGKLPGELNDLIRKCLEKEPEKRHHSFEELKNELKSIYEKEIGKEYPREIPPLLELRADGLNNKALSLLNLKRKDEARECLEEALRLDKGNLSANVNLGLLKWKNGWATNKEILEYFETAVSQHSDDTLSHYYKGVILFEMGEIGEAIKKFDESLKIDSKNDKAWNYKGVCFFANENYTKAEECFTQAVSIEPKKEYLRNLGHSQYAQKKHKEAAETFKTVFDLEPEDVDTKVDYAIALTGIGNYEETINQLMEALVINPDSTRANLNLGEFLAGIDNYIHTFNYETTDYKKAEKYLENAYTHTSYIYRFYESYKVCIEKLGNETPIFSPEYEISNKKRLRKPFAYKCLKTLEGHSDDINSVAFSLDGRFLASGSRDKRLSNNSKSYKKERWIGLKIRKEGNFLVSKTIAGQLHKTIKIWDVATWECLKTLEEHSNWIKSVAFSPDGRFLVSGSRDKIIKIWDVATWECLKTLEGHSYDINSVAFSPDGRFLASGSDDKIIKIWDVSTGKCLKTLEGHSSYVNSVAFSPDGRFLASGTEKNCLSHLSAKLNIWDVATWECLKTLEGHSDNINSVAFSPDGRFLASGSDDGTIKIWDVATWECLKTLEGRSDWVRSVAFSPDGRILASGGNGEIKIWDVATWGCLKTLEGYYSNSVAFSPDGRFLASGRDDGTIKIWVIKRMEEFPYEISYDYDFLIEVPRSVEEDIKTEEEYKKLLKHAEYYEIEGKYANAHNILREIIKLPGYEKNSEILKKITFLGNKNGKKRGIRNYWAKKTLKGHSKSVNSVAFSPDGKFLASGSYDKTIRIWDVAIEECIKTLKGHSKVVNSVAFSPDGKFLASGSGVTYESRKDSTIKIWDVATWECLKTLEGRPYSVSSVAFSPDVKLLATDNGYIGYNHTVKIWDVANWECLKTLKRNGSVTSVAFSPNGKFLASGCGNDSYQAIVIWDVASGEYLKTLDGHNYAASSVAFSPDGRFLVSGGRSERGAAINIWDVATWECLKTLEGHSDVISVAFSPDGRFLASGGRRTLKIQDVTTGKCLKTLEGRSSVTSVAFSPDGRFLTSGSADKTIRIWEIDWDWEFSDGEEVEKTLTLDMEPQEKEKISVPDKKKT